ncbi:MAG: 4Fe-4S binding protein, partial [Proteobacteria bacterium]|nr:4Fe-4S binding protein [Pseudomonadota bacterium]
MSSSPEPTVAVIKMYAAREEIYPREIKGRYTTLRWVFVWLTQLVFYGLPWLAWNGRQAVLFDLGARKFYLFGLVLWPQDFIYLAALLIISAWLLFLATAIAGRVWCGFSCPQTVYTEIFMWIERKIEGNRSARMRLDKQPVSLNKIARKSAKH